MGVMTPNKVARFFMAHGVYNQLNLLYLKFKSIKLR